jgi:hypothetical protein
LSKSPGGREREKEVTSGTEMPNPGGKGAAKVSLHAWSCCAPSAPAHGCARAARERVRARTRADGLGVRGSRRRRRPQQKRCWMTPRRMPIPAILQRQRVRDTARAGRRRAAHARSARSHARTHARLLARSRWVRDGSAWFATTHARTQERTHIRTHARTRCARAHSLAGTRVCTVLNAIDVQVSSMTRWCNHLKTRH